VTSDFCKRVWEHTNNVAEGLTRKCGVHSLVYDELRKDMSRSSGLRGQ
jgi:putative endonuclease